ncbi:T9SS type A sorting domain-containing protein [Aestuariibaculum lutulentum]|uniref:T9SS type A sorting domain-containing protein n=1 Tax=Aestuariibaculum lutulentum TaxID=2920935 RepID=A0ABS9RFH0_9FLAO|nr:T9SS type A sorting domain-containing protein [Aestuariibaculum lutulentum]MCH4551691.1 T9SS type A sorting domain-containing protein [Aestuariibaculum lutulentum]
MINKFTSKCRTKVICLLLFISMMGYAQNPVVKIDFDQSGRSESEVNQVGYTPWVISGVTTSSKTENGVTFTVTKAGSFGDVIGSNWYKAGIQASDDGKLVNDGLTVRDGTANQGGQIEFRISGLETGTHTLLAFLNAVDSGDTNTFSPIDISIDGNLVEDDVIPTVRATNSVEAKSVYLTFEATEGNDVVILFAAETSGSENIKNVMLNGFELNTPNIFYQATNPIPADNNEHVELNSGGVLLEWTPAASAVNQYVYFGTDELAVDEADTSSSEYKGNQDNTNNNYQVNSLYTGDTYYWRIDQETSEGEITKGNVWRFRPAQLAFPGAEGYGRFARGGRGGKVVLVTNLNDSGSGSLREAVTNDIGPRTIVFNVSGIIELQSRLVCNSPYVTIAGQTAPGKGITIKAAPFGITGDDNVVQNIRVRLGGGQTYDGMGLTGANHSIIDHCSISWTIDEAFSSRGAHNITLQRTLISEALNAAGHQNYPVGTEHGYAASIGGDVGSFHHNLLAHNYGRNWSLAGGLDGDGYYSGLLDITNNVVYNWGGRTTDGGTKELNFVGNYYKPGPGMQLERYALTVDHENVGMGMQRAYFAGNVMPGYFDESNQDYGRRSRDSNGAVTEYETFVDTPFFPSYVTTQSADLAYKMVLSDVGCTQPVFDDHDIRMINETLNGTYSVTGSYTGKKGFPDDEADAGGYENYPVITRAADWDSDGDGLPNWWETIIGTNINSPSGDFSDANSDDNSDGYTNLDYYLQWMSLPHFSTETGEAISVNLQELSRGFTNNPTYQVFNEENGNANLAGNIVQFTPGANGFASFDFRVTDSDGDSMTRTVNMVNGYDLTLTTEIKKLSDVKIWPIPNRGTFYVNTGQRDENTEYKLFDILGREVSRGIINVNETKEINLNAKGVFVVKLYEPSGKRVLHTQKLIVR